MARAQEASVVAVTAAAHGASLLQSAGVVVTRRAIPSAIAPYCSASRLDTDSASASLPKPLPISSPGRAFAGWVASPSRSRTVLLYSNGVSRRTGARPGRTIPSWHLFTPGVPIEPGVPGTAPPVVFPAPLGIPGPVGLLPGTAPPLVFP